MSGGEENGTAQKSKTSMKRKQGTTETKATTKKQKVSDTDSDADGKKAKKKSDKCASVNDSKTDSKKQHKAKSDADTKSQQKASGLKKQAQTAKGAWKGTRGRGRGSHGCGTQSKKSNLPSQLAVKTGSIEIKMDFGGC